MPMQVSEGGYSGFFHFDDYSVEDLVQILFKMQEQKGRIICAKTSELEALIREHVTDDLLAKHNAGFCNAWFDAAIEKQNLDIYNTMLDVGIEVSDVLMQTLTVDHFAAVLSKLVASL